MRLQPTQQLSQMGCPRQRRAAVHEANPVKHVSSDSHKLYCSATLGLMQAATVAAAQGAPKNTDRQVSQVSRVRLAASELHAKPQQVGISVEIFPGGAIGLSRRKHGNTVTLPPNKLIYSTPLHVVRAKLLRSIENPQRQRRSITASTPC